MYSQGIRDTGDGGVGERHVRRVGKALKTVNSGLYAHQNALTEPVTTFFDPELQVPEMGVTL